MNAPDARISKRQASTPHPTAPSRHARRSKLKSAIAPHRTLVTPEEWQSMVAEAAYYQAEHRGFVPCYELDVARSGRSDRRHIRAGRYTDALRLLTNHVRVMT